MNMMKNNLWGIAKFVMGIALGILLIVPISLMAPGRPQSEPMILIENTYVPFAGCPGGLSPEYNLVWDIRRPVIALIDVAHLRAPDGDTAIPSREGDTFVTGFPTARRTSAGDETDPGSLFMIPDLPPGDYERVIMVSTRSSSKPIFVVQPYTVRDDCPK